MLAMLLPSSNAPIRRSRMASRLVTTAASRLPCLVSRSMLARDAPVNAVSLAAKNAETSSKATTTDNVSQSMRWFSLHLGWSTITAVQRFALVGSCSGFLRQLGLEKIANQRRLNVRSNHRPADRLEQDEGEPAALDLLVLRHQRHQRIGIDE